MSTQFSLEELHNVELAVLQEFHNFCEKYHLTYYLQAGTLLGAIRHNGFIPWDDDVDVAMPRSDYNKFLQLFPKHNKLTYLKLADINTPNYYLPIAKLYDERFRLEELNLRHSCVLGPWIDIFPLDNMSNNINTAVNFFNQVALWRRLNNFKAVNYRSKKRFRYYIRRFVTVLLSVIPQRWLLRIIDNKSQRYKSETLTKYICAVGSTSFGSDKIMKSEWFEAKHLHSFEDRKFYIPNGWHEILTNFYGDYMVLPPIEQRTTHF